MAARHSRRSSKTSIHRWAIILPQIALPIPLQLHICHPHRLIPSDSRLEWRFQFDTGSQYEEKRRKKNHNNTTHEEKKSVFCWLDWLIFFSSSQHTLVSAVPTSIYLYVNLTSYEKFSFFFSKNISLRIQPSYRQYLEFALKLGYPERLIQTALSRLGGSPTNNELLAELIKLGAQPGSNGESRKRKKRTRDVWKERRKQKKTERNERRSWKKSAAKKVFFSFFLFHRCFGLFPTATVTVAGLKIYYIIPIFTRRPSLALISSLLMSFLLRFSPLFCCCSPRAPYQNRIRPPKPSPISRSSPLLCCHHLTW